MKKVPMKGIDAHIHLDLYQPTLEPAWFETLHKKGISGVVAVSIDLKSCKLVQDWHRLYPHIVHPAYGFHPEQKRLDDQQLQELIDWMDRHQTEMVAIGEVGLPYFRRREYMKNGDRFDQKPYIELLEQFAKLAAKWDKPIVLHALYDDAEIACDILERNSVNHAHFHWFKGARKTTERMLQNGYYISFTPDIVYEAEIQQLASQYPLALSMVETDGPWPFSGPFEGTPTHPSMIKNVAQKLAQVKGLPLEEVIEILWLNTLKFYRIPLAE